MTGPSSGVEGSVGALLLDYENSPATSLSKDGPRQDVDQERRRGWGGGILPGDTTGSSAVPHQA